MTPPTTKNPTPNTRRRGRPKKSHKNRETRLSTSRKPPPSPTLPTSNNNTNDINQNPYARPTTNIATATMTTRRKTSHSHSQQTNSRKRRRPPPAMSVTNVFTEDRLPQTCKDFWTWPVTSWYVGDLDEADLRLTDDRPFRDSNLSQKNSNPIPKHYRLQWLEQDASIAAGLSQPPAPMPQNLPLMPYARQKDTTGCARPSLGLTPPENVNDTNSNKPSKRNSRSRTSVGKRPAKHNFSPKDTTTPASSSTQNTPTVIPPRTSAKAPRRRPSSSLVEPKVQPSINFPDNKITAYMRPADEKSAMQISPGTPLGQRMVLTPTTEALKHSQSTSQTNISPDTMNMAPLAISPNAHIGNFAVGNVKVSPGNEQKLPIKTEAESRRDIRIQLVSPDEPRLMGTLTYSVPISSSLSSTKVEDQQSENSGKIFKQDGIFLDQFELDFRKSDSDFLSSFEDAEKKDDLGHEANRLDDVLETLNSKTKPLRDVALSAVMNEIKNQEAHRAMFSREKEIKARLAEIAAEKRRASEPSNLEIKIPQGKGRRKSLETSGKPNSVESDTPELGLEICSMEDEEISVEKNNAIFAKSHHGVDSSASLPNLAQEYQQEISSDVDEDPDVARSSKRRRVDNGNRLDSKLMQTHPYKIPQSGYIHVKGQNIEFRPIISSYGIVREFINEMVAAATASSVPEAKAQSDITEHVKLESEEKLQETKIDSGTTSTSAQTKARCVDSSIIIHDILSDVISASLARSIQKNTKDFANSSHYTRLPLAFDNQDKYGKRNHSYDNRGNFDDPSLVELPESRADNDGSSKTSSATNDKETIDSRDSSDHGSHLENDSKVVDHVSSASVEVKEETMATAKAVRDIENDKLVKIDLANIKANETVDEENIPCNTVVGATDAYELDNNSGKVDRKKYAAMKDNEFDRVTTSFKNGCKGTQPLSPCFTDSPVMLTSPCGIFPKEEEKNDEGTKNESPLSPILGMKSDSNDSKKNCQVKNEWKQEENEVGGSPVSDEDNGELCSEKKVDEKKAVV